MVTHISPAACQHTLRPYISRTLLSTPVSGLPDYYISVLSTLYTLLRSQQISGYYNYTSQEFS
jgi:hypothetical protein